jgi:hypothetical protein
MHAKLAQRDWIDQHAEQALISWPTHLFENFAVVVRVPEALHGSE